MQTTSEAPPPGNSPTHGRADQKLIRYIERDNQARWQLARVALLAVVVFLLAVVMFARNALRTRDEIAMAALQSPTLSEHIDAEVARTIDGGAASVAIARAAGAAATRAITSDSSEAKEVRAQLAESIAESDTVRARFRTTASDAVAPLKKQLDQVVAAQVAASAARPQTHPSQDDRLNALEARVQRMDGELALYRSALETLEKRADVASAKLGGLREPVPYTVGTGSIVHVAACGLEVRIGKWEKGAAQVDVAVTGANGAETAQWRSLQSVPIGKEIALREAGASDCHLTITSHVRRRLAPDLVTFEVRVAR